MNENIYFFERHVTFYEELETGMKEIGIESSPLLRSSVMAGACWIPWNLSPLERRGF